VNAEELLTRLDADQSARRAMWLVWPFGVLVIAIVGRRQWFIADDWAFLLAREHLRVGAGLDDMLMLPQDGHWMMWPLLVFRGLRAVFGMGSYVPYLLVLWATHLGLVALARTLMVRLGASPWTATLMSCVLLVFGAGWENLFFAVQIVYTFSLLAFLAQLLLVDHDGPPDRRDWIGSAIAVIGVSSSGFGPFFAFGVGLLLLIRRRWTALLIAAVPQALALGWWWLTWGDDPAGDTTGTAGPRFVGHFTVEGLASTFGSLAGTRLLAGGAAVLALAVALWPRTPARSRQIMIVLLATATVMYAGIGARREVFGLNAATWSRYQYMAAFLVAPVLAVGLDQARHFAAWAKWVPRVVLVLIVARNVNWMQERGDAWADRTRADRRVMSLVAGSAPPGSLDPLQSMSLESPDVRAADVPLLIDTGAITPIAPVSAGDQAAVDAVLGASAGTGFSSPGR
jgi:hypothetical protein